MITSIRHQHSYMQNQEVEWFSSDAERRFKDMMAIPDKRALLEENGWDKNKFTYKFNSHGFRADEFVEEDSIVFLGPSVVFGTGVPNEVTWPYLVSQQLLLRNFNLGISGGSNDSSFRLGAHYIPQLKPKYVIFVTSYTDRLDIITSEHVRTLLHNDWNLPNRYKEFYKDWIINDENGQLNLQKNLYAIRHICQANDVVLIEVDGDTMWNRPEEPTGNISRDLAHPGVEMHRSIADKILEMVTVVGLEPTTFGV